MANLYMRQFCCDKTTELGADEIYFMIYGRRSDGETFFQRYPSPNGHFDLNDGGQPTDNPAGDSHCITRKTLFDAELGNGQSWQLSVLVMEEDGGSTIDYQKAVGGLATKIPNPIAAGAGAVLVALAGLGMGIQDTDDYPGSFVVNISKDAAGTLSVAFGGGDHIAHIIADPDDPGNPHKAEYRFNGDGSNYVGWFAVYQ